MYYLGNYKKVEQIDWGKVTRLVFVCRGNVCRSPYAEMKAKGLDLNATSIGLDTTEGSPANAKAIKSASYRNVMLDEPRARVYKLIKITNNDLVVCMEPWQLKKFGKIDSSGCQITLLGLLCTNKKIIINDPYGKPDDFYDDCFQEIDAAMQNIIVNLEATPPLGR